MMKTYQPLPPLEVINPGVKVFSNYVDPEVTKEVICYEEEPVIDEDTNEVSGQIDVYRWIPHQLQTVKDLLRRIILNCVQPIFVILKLK
jgi:hypothetical protein